MSNPTANGPDVKGAGFAVRCDPAGVVRAFLFQDGEPCHSVLVGRGLQDSTDKDSRLKMENFLAAAHSPQPVVGWELDMPYSGGLRSMTFAAVNAGGGLVIAAATGAAGLARLLNELMTKGPLAEGESARLLDKAAREVLAKAEAEGHFFDELTRLNNELANLQRQLAMSNLALQRQRQWLWNILASLDDAVVATGMDGMVTFMNASAARLTGRDLGSTSPVALTELLHLADGRGMAAAEISLRPVLAEGRTIVVQGYLLREPALNPVPVSGAANPLLDQDGSPIGALVMLRDMTEALRIQQLMVESERLGVAAEMAAGVAHTVNNVLLIISGNAEALTRHLPPERQRQVENIHAGVRRISDLTARLLTFTDAGPENAGSVDLNDVIRSSVALEGPFPPEVRMHLALSPAPVMVRGAAEKLSVAVSSVLRNAREAIQGPGLIDISTWSEPGPEHGEHIFLCIRDNGEGMTTEVQQRLFTPFVSTKFLGRGLGLATARATLAAHGGHLAIESMPGKGTTVTITLPAAADWRTVIRPAIP